MVLGSSGIYYCLGDPLPGAPEGLEHIRGPVASDLPALWPLPQVTRLAKVNSLVIVRELISPGDPYTGIVY